MLLVLLFLLLVDRERFLVTVVEIGTTAISTARVAENRVARQRRCYEGKATSTKKELTFFLQI